MSPAKDDVMIAIGLASQDGSTAPKIVQVAGFRFNQVLVRLRMGGFKASGKYARVARAVSPECLVRHASERELTLGRVVDPL